MTLTTSFNHKKATAYTWCEWDANTSSIASAVLDDDATQSSCQTNIITSWSTFIYLLSSNTVDITTYLGSSHPAGTLTIYRHGAVVKTHTVAANQKAIFLDTFDYSEPENDFKVVW